jgi:ElaB/YqjD/DUF883 family membrane-anchored ribosome-binding protein
MQAPPANEPRFQDEDSMADPAVDELNRIVAQAEALLRQVGDETGAAAEAVRERVTQTLHQARAKLAASAVEAGHIAEGVADRADKYVRANPWQSVAIAALLGGVVTLLVSRMSRR